VTVAPYVPSSAMMDFLQRYNLVEVVFGSATPLVRAETIYSGPARDAPLSLSATCRRKPIVVPCNRIKNTGDNWRRNDGHSAAELAGEAGGGGGRRR
jgi:hypothetical protein